jgi:hypothetical protein
MDEHLTVDSGDVLLAVGTTRRKYGSWANSGPAHPTLVRAIPGARRLRMSDPGSVGRLVLGQA